MRWQSGRKSNTKTAYGAKKAAKPTGQQTIAKARSVLTWHTLQAGVCLWGVSVPEKVSSNMHTATANRGKYPKLASTNAQTTVTKRCLKKIATIMPPALERPTATHSCASHGTGEDGDHLLS